MLHLRVEALERIGKKRWNRRLEQAIAGFSGVVHYDRLYLGGGNARHIRFTLDSRTTVISNEAGIRGGIVLWQPPAA